MIFARRRIGRGEAHQFDHPGGEFESAAIVAADPAGGTGGSRVSGYVRLATVLPSAIPVKITWYHLTQGHGDGGLNSAATEALSPSICRPGPVGGGARQLPPFPLPLLVPNAPTGAPRADQATIMIQRPMAMAQPSPAGLRVRVRQRLARDRQHREGGGAAR